MPLFRCSKCGCVENSALGNFWSAERADTWPEGTILKPTCSECGPKLYRDGTPTKYGTWHGRFEKKSATGMLVDQSGHLWSSDELLPKHYKIVGQVAEDGSVRPIDSSI